MDKASIVGLFAAIAASFLSAAVSAAPVRSIASPLSMPEATMTVPNVRASIQPTIGMDAAYKRATRIKAAARTKSNPSVTRKTRTGRLPSKAALVRRVAAESGLSEKETWYLLEIARLESGVGTNPLAYVPTRKYLGIFQLGPHLGTVEQRLDDVWNTKRAIRYIRGRYGSFAAAYSFRVRKGWY